MPDSNDPGAAQIAESLRGVLTDPTSANHYAENNTTTTVFEILRYGNSRRVSQVIRPQETATMRLIEGQSTSATAM